MNRRIDVQYAGDSAAQRLSLLRPAGAGPFPLVVWIHGGGWHSGSPDLQPDAPQHRVLEHGIALASVGYRLSHEAVFPAQLLDVRHALRWLVQHADEHDVDGSRIAVWGASAGGHLAALLGTAPHVRFDAAAPAPPEPRVCAVVDWFGPTDMLAMDEQTVDAGCQPFNGSGHDAPDSPESRLFGFPIQQRPAVVRCADPALHVTREITPFLVMHGTRDCIVPSAQGRHLADRITHIAGARRAQFVTVDAGHGGAAFRSHDVVTTTIDFLRLHLRPVT